jgi:hypothetical protein
MPYAFLQEIRSLWTADVEGDNPFQASLVPLPSRSSGLRYEHTVLPASALDEVQLGSIDGTLRRATNVSRSSGTVSLRDQGSMRTSAMAPFSVRSAHAGEARAATSLQRTLQRSERAVKGALVDYSDSVLAVSTNGLLTPCYVRRLEGPNALSIGGESLLAYRRYGELDSSVTLLGPLRGRPRPFIQFGAVRRSDEEYGADARIGVECLLHWSRRKGGESREEAQARRFSRQVDEKIDSLGFRARGLVVHASAGTFMDGKGKYEPVFSLAMGLAFSR